MQIATTFNVGLFVAVVLGYALGAALLSHIPDNYAAYMAVQRSSRSSKKDLSHFDAMVLAEKGTPNVILATSSQEAAGAGSSSGGSSSNMSINIPSCTDHACCPQAR